MPDAAGSNGENDIRALITHGAALNIHGITSVEESQPSLAIEWHFSHGAFGYVGLLSTVKEGTTSQDTAGRFMESVSLLSAFKASSYGCGEPGAPFQQGGKDQGKGQSMRHNDLILSHAVMRYCSLTCWEEDKEWHTRL